MKLPASRPNRIALDMTPMIDIVFQLLIFFILTLQITAVEGDFQVAMPANNVSAKSWAATALPLLRVRLLSDEHGGLKAVYLNDRQLGNLDELHDLLGRTLGSDQQLAAAAEVELCSDYNLAYQHTMAAVTAVSGQRTATGQTVKWVEIIRFSQPKT